MKINISHQLTGSGAHEQRTLAAGLLLRWSARAHTRTPVRGDGHTRICVCSRTLPSTLYALRMTEKPQKGAIAPVPSCDAHDIQILVTHRL